MVQQLTSFKCGYCTKQIGHYNRHVNKPGGCKRKEVEHCAHCQKTFAVNGSGLRKHACLASDLLPFQTRLSADCTRSVDAALQKLQKLSKYHLKQLGFADLDPLNVAVAAIRFLHLNLALAHSQNITPCQHCASKFDIVQRCCGVLVWVPWPKDDILPVLLDEAADIVEGLVEVVPSKLPKRQAGHLIGYVNHVLRPCWKSNHPEWYEEMYRRQRPNLVENRDAVCAAVTALEFRWCNELGCMHW